MTVPNYTCQNNKLPLKKSQIMTIEIVIPYYGGPDLLDQAVKSVKAQSDRDWHLTVIDDGFPDNEAEEVIKRNTDNRISFFKNQTNQGINRTFQQAIELSNSNFLTIMGSDDRLLPNYVERMKNIFSALPSLSYIQPGIEVIDQNGEHSFPLGDRVKYFLMKQNKPPGILKGEVAASSILRGNWTYFPSICWKREIVADINFRKNFNIVLDLALQLDILNKDGFFYLDDTVSFQYRRHSNSASSLSSFNGIRFFEEKELFKEFEQTFQQKGWKSASNSAKWHITSRLNSLSLLSQTLPKAQWHESRSLIKHAFQR